MSDRFYNIQNIPINCGTKLHYVILPIVCYTQSISDHVLLQSYMPHTFLFLPSLLFWRWEALDKPWFLEGGMDRVKFVSDIHFLLPGFSSVP